MTHIVYNAIQCKFCQNIIQSQNVHDFKFCSCGKVAVDGGTVYLSRTGEREDYIDLSLDTTSPYKKIREVFTWGKNYDAQGKILPHTIWVKLKDLAEDHLEALLVYPNAPEWIKLLFIQEKLYRNEREY